MRYSEEYVKGLEKENKILRDAIVNEIEDSMMYEGSYEYDERILRLELALAESKK